MVYFFIFVANLKNTTKMSKSIAFVFEGLDQVDIDNNIDEINNQVDYWESKGYVVYNESDNPEHIVPRPKRPI